MGCTRCKQAAQARALKKYGDYRQARKINPPLPKNKKVKIDSIVPQKSLNSEMATKSIIDIKDDDVKVNNDAKVNTDMDVKKNKGKVNKGKVEKKQLSPEQIKKLKQQKDNMKVNAKNVQKKNAKLRAQMAKHLKAKTKAKAVTESK